MVKTQNIMKEKMGRLPENDLDVVVVKVINILEMEWRKDEKHF